MEEKKEVELCAQDVAQEIKEHNLRFYSQCCEVPADALKPIKAGRLKGMSDVNPMWRMKRMTEIFGPCGFGWKYEIVKQWTEEYTHESTEEFQDYQESKPPVIANDGKVLHQGTPAIPGRRIQKRSYEVKCFCNINLYVRDPETKEWSAPIPGNGGSAIVSKEKTGLYVNDEGYKMALTDALSIAMKPLGIGGNIWYGPKATGHNESKYEAYTREQPQAQQLAYSDGQMRAAIAEISSVTTKAQFDAVWNNWANTCPAICQNTTEFYKAACTKINQISSAAQ